MSYIKSVSYIKRHGKLSVYINDIRLDPVRMHKSLKGCISFLRAGKSLPHDPVIRFSLDNGVYYVTSGLIPAQETDIGQWDRYLADFMGIDIVDAEDLLLDYLEKQHEEEKQ